MKWNICTYTPFHFYNGIHAYCLTRDDDDTYVHMYIHTCVHNFSNFR